MLSRKDGGAVLDEISLAATGLQRDLLPLVHRVARERARFPDGGVELQEISFWFKCLIHEALAFVDGLCHTMRVVLSRFAIDLEAELTSKQRAVIQDTSLQQPIKRIVSLTFRALPKLFGGTFELDTGGTDYRAFSAMVEARERFTHPKLPEHIHPFAALATMNSALKWVLFSWRELLEACAASIREAPEEHLPPPPDRGPQFDEKRLGSVRK